MADPIPAPGAGRMEPRSGRTRDLFFYERNCDFAFAVDQLIELQDLTGAGPLTLCQRLGDGSWRLQDITETLRLGLVGAGMDREAAFALVTRAVKPGYLAQSAIVAATVLRAVIFGVEEDAPGESMGEAGTESQTSPTAESAGPGSSESAAEA